MAKPPGREMAADDGALTNLTVKQFRILLGRTEATRPKNIMNRIIEVTCSGKSRSAEIGPLNTPANLER